jgi:23S rRNA (uracil1939-C5)-methyltransferase
VSKLERREVTIEKIVAGGHGLARTERGAVLVPRVAPGEQVAIELEKPPRARLLKVLSPSVDRVDPCCALVDKCGGCDLMHLSPDAQKQARIAILKETLGDHAIAWHEATPARGRTRARWHAKTLGGGRTVLGYKGLGSSTIVDVAACAILDPRLDSAPAVARSIVAAGRGEGDVHVAIGESGKPVLSIEWKGELPVSAYAQAEKHVQSGALAGVEILLEGARTSAKMGDPRPTTIAFDGLPLHTPAGGFAQASEVGDRVLVELVRERAQAAKLKVVELFAGSGNFTIALARDAASVTAVELAAPACDAARDNLKARAIDNVKVVTADADAYAIPQGTDVVVLDPPRSGARGAMTAIAARRVRRVVYVSCDPTTLGRDLALLPNHRVVSVDAVNLFPETSHVETIVVLERTK